mmetsp:Transcript_10271/g.30514  ORF Transcript_10271/g.30514 Transcript_10271/m.30514 type:complete len:213 (-) Transcript_10271:1024-1662(-)
MDRAGHEGLPRAARPVAEEDAAAQVDDSLGGARPRRVLLRRPVAGVLQQNVPATRGQGSLHGAPDRHVARFDRDEASHRAESEKGAGGGAALRRAPAAPSAGRGLGRQHRAVPGGVGPSRQGGRRGARAPQRRGLVADPEPRGLRELGLHHVRHSQGRRDRAALAIHGGLRRVRHVYPSRPVGHPLGRSEGLRRGRKVERTYRVRLPRLLVH